MAVAGPLLLRLGAGSGVQREWPREGPLAGGELQPQGEGAGGAGGIGAGEQCPSSLWRCAAPEFQVLWRWYAGECLGSRAVQIRPGGKGASQAPRGPRFWFSGGAPGA